MFSYAMRRLVGALPTLFLIIVLAFTLMRLTPGGPFDKERQLPPDIEANLMKQYHMDEPLPMQFGRYMFDLLRGDFGPSFKYKDFSVTELIWGGLPVSATLGGIAIVIAIFLGSLAGIIAALNQNKGTDYSVMAIAMFGVTVPNFVVAPLLTLVFGLWLGWVPVGGWGSWTQAILPIVALSLLQIAYVSRLMRGSMLEILNSNYIRTAKAKGLPRRVIIMRHALKAALPPIVSYLGPAMAGIITGSVVIETIFGIPGIGRYFVQGALNRDYTLVLGVTIFFAIAIIFLNLLADLIYGWLDPKVRYE